MTATDPEPREALQCPPEPSSAVGPTKSYARFDLAKSDEELLADVCDWLVEILGPPDEDIP